jgi:hypothetical protein
MGRQGQVGQFHGLEAGPQPLDSVQVGAWAGRRSMASQDCWVFNQTRMALLRQAGSPSHSSVERLEPQGLGPLREPLKGTVEAESLDGFHWPCLTRLTRSRTAWSRTAAQHLPLNRVGAPERQRQDLCAADVMMAVAPIVVVPEGLPSAGPAPGLASTRGVAADAAGLIQRVTTMGGVSADLRRSGGSWY